MRLYNLLQRCSAGLAILLVACGGKTSGDDGTRNATGGASAADLSGGAAANSSGTYNAGGAGATSGASNANGATEAGGAYNAGSAAKGGSANNTGGAAKAGGASSTGGASATGGRSPPSYATGGNTASGTAVCAAPNVCGKLLDANYNVVDCGFANCPQGVCGLGEPNQCPLACTKKTCGPTDCGLVPDGIGGTIDCGYTACSKDSCGTWAPGKCPPTCVSKVTCGIMDCGFKADGCGGTIDCGPVTCGSTTGVNLCGLVVPNQCPSTCITKINCASAGKNCGPISDGCGGTIDCGMCQAPTCCGCGSNGSPGVANVCGGPPYGIGTSLEHTCLAGQKGCACDSLGGCAPGLSCNLTKTPSLCCNGADCDLPPNTMVGSSCAGTLVPTGCTPGITIPAASGANDNCGYPAASFNESQFFCGIVATGGGAAPAQVQAFFNDEMAMTLGCNQNGYSVSPMPTDPGYVLYPSTGDPNCADSNRRPLRPALYITDITNDINCTDGDQQQGGEPYDPIAILGAWKAVTNGTPDANPTAFNYWDLTNMADPIPDAVSAQCPCKPPPTGVAPPSTAGDAGGNVAQFDNCPGTAQQARGFGTEARWEAALLPGHSYRLQIMAHDGDPTPGGDAAEACVIYCAASDTACTPQVCPAGACGMQGDGCGGTIDCGPCTCKPQGCAAGICGKQGDGCGGIIDCGPCCTPRSCPTDACGKQGDGCGGVIDCPCPCVPQTCPACACGKASEGCGGVLDCGPCCTPWTCEDWCPGNNSGNIRECTSTKDDISSPNGAIYLLACPKPDGCSGVLSCWCPLG